MNELNEITVLALACVCTGYKRGGEESKKVLLLANSVIYRINHHPNKRFSSTFFLFYTQMC